MPLFDSLPPPIRRAFSTTRPGLVPASVSATGKILRDDGTFVTALLAYKGGVAGGTVPPTSTAAGDYYIITSAGTSQGETWAVGDLAIYEGTSGNWTQLAGITVMKLVAMPANTAAAGAPGEYAVSATQRADYVSGTGWVFSNVYQI
jgi:hypothetical protein